MNELKVALREGRVQWGLWQALANPYTAEVCAGLGFDWLLFDGEHAPNSVQTLLAQLQAVEGRGPAAVARVPVGDAPTLKQYLDIGFRSLLVPMVESALQARAIVAATRFPPHGTRGVASTFTRAARFGSDRGFLATAHDDLCIILQIESRTGLDALEDIAAVDGVDALFIGPADLAADLGHLGNAAHPSVQSAMEDAVGRIRAAGRAAGLYATSIEDARSWAARGATLVSVGSDVGLLTHGGRALVQAIGA